MLRNLLFAAVASLVIAATATAAAPAKPFVVTTGMVQVRLMSAGLAATSGATTVRTKVNRAFCVPGGPFVNGVGYVKVRCTIWTPTGTSTIMVSTFSRGGTTWFFRWRFA